MTQGYASDIIGDDTVMDDPEATIRIDLTQLPLRQALAVARAAGLDQQEDYIVGAMVKGNLDETDYQYMNDAVFHIPVEAALTALEELNVVSQPTPEVEEVDEENI
jgi:hypothetical protein